MATPLNGSLIKAFEILDLFCEHKPQITSTDVARALDMSPSTAHRFLLTLEEVGAVVQLRRGVFCLGHHVAHLGRIADLTNPLATLVQPVIGRISAAMNESVMAGQLKRDGVLCLATAIAPRPISVNIRVGRVLDLQGSAQGKLWLAHMAPADRDARIQALLRNGKLTETSAREFRDELERARKNGFACNRGESEPDIGAVAVPIFDRRGALRLTLSAFGMASRFSPDHEAVIAAHLWRASEEIAEAFPAWSTPRA